MDDGSTKANSSMTDPDKSSRHHHKNSGASIRSKGSSASAGSKGSSGNSSVTRASDKALAGPGTMVTVVPSDELMEYSPSSETSKPVDLSNNNNNTSTNHHHHSHSLGQDASTATTASMPTFNNSTSNNNNNNESPTRGLVAKHVGGSLSINCGGSLLDGNSANLNNSSSGSSSSSNSSISSVNSGGNNSNHSSSNNSNNNNGILSGIGIIGASSPLTATSRVAADPPTSNGGGGGGTGRKLSFSVENILDPNKFTGKNSTLLHSPHHKNLLHSPKLLAAQVAVASQHHHHHHAPSSNFRFAYKEIHGKGKYKKRAYNILQVKSRLFTLPFENSKDVFNSHKNY